MWARILGVTAICGVVILAPAIVAAQGSADTAADRPDVFGQSEYRVGPEDVINVFVWNEKDITGDVVVRPDGKITVPPIGEIVANHRTAKDLEAEITTKLQTFFDPAPVVNVTVKEINNPKISVFGEVKKPDVYKIKQKTNVVEAITMAGGFTDYANRKRTVLLIRGTQKTVLVLKDMLNGGKAPIFILEPGDIIYVQ